MKVVQTDESARKPENVPVSSEDERNAVFQLQKAISSNEATKSKKSIYKKGLNWINDHFHWALHQKAGGIK